MLGSLVNRVKAAASAFSTGGYNAATGGRRVIHMGSTTRGVNSLALSDGPQLLSRARKAAMDTDLAAAGINAFISEVIGTGRRPHFKHPDPATRAKLQREWNLWVPQASSTRRLGPGGKPESCQNFYMQEALVCRNLAEAGEAFARLRPRLVSDLSPTGLRVPLQIELIEPEQLAFWRQSGDMASPNNIMRGSIEFDAIRQRVAYHFYRDHPGDSTVWPNAYEVTRVPAESVLHVIEFIRGNQIRGITPLAPILIQLADLDDYDDAERFRQKLGAYLFGWQETLTPDDPNQSGTSTSVGTDQAASGTSYAEVAPGQLKILDTNAGEKFGFYAHPGTPNGYAVFVREQQRTDRTTRGRGSA
jgi:lambda family phage portal protein